MEHTRRRVMKEVRAYENIVGEIVAQEIRASDMRHAYALWQHASSVDGARTAMLALSAVSISWLHALKQGRTDAASPFPGGIDAASAYPKLDANADYGKNWRPSGNSGP